MELDDLFPFSLLPKFTAPRTKRFSKKKVFIINRRKKTTSEMASTAKTVQNNLVSYAGVVSGKGVKAPFFATTVCNIRIPKNMPNKRIPNTTEAYSFFVDLTNIKGTEEEIANAITLDGIIGAKYRADLGIVEFICADSEVQQKALTTEFEVKGKGSFIAIAPRHLLQRTVLIKIANMDFGKEEDLRRSLFTYWSKYGEVVDLAPHKFPGKSWLTQRWDILLTLPKDTKKLKAPVIFKLENSERTLLATWSGAAKSCIKCLAAGHATSNCRGKNPKLGERPNPEKKDQQGTQAKNGQGKVDPEKTPQMGLDKVPLPKSKETVETGAQSASVSIPKSVSETVSESASASTSKSVTKSGDSETKEPEKQLEKEFEGEDPLDYGRFLREGIIPSWIDHEIWISDHNRITAEQWTRINADPPPKVYLGNGIEIMDGQEKEDQREVTTPPPHQLEDPETPRKGGKRMAKEEKAGEEGFKKFAATEEAGVRRSGRKRKAKK